MRVKSIRPAGNQDVYNMEVDETHDFAVNGGVIVHNCYDECRYVLMANPIAPRINAKADIPLYDPLDMNEEKKLGRYDWYAKY